MTDINFDLVQPTTSTPVSKPRKTDAVAGPVLPAQPKYIEQAIHEFMGTEAAIILPPIPQEKDLVRHVPSSEQLLARAKLLIDHGDKRNAAHLIRQALSIHAGNPTAMRLMIETLGDSEFARKEKAQLRKALTRYQPCFENFFELAKVQYAQAEIDNAARSIEHAFCFPTEDARMLFDANKMIGNISLQQGDIESAEEFYHKAFSLNAHSAALLVNLGTLEVQRRDYVRANERFEEALRICRKANGADTENEVKALVGLFLVSRETSGAAARVDYLIEALQINPNHRTAVHLYAHFSHQGETHAAAIPVLENYLDDQVFDEEMSLVATQFYCMQGLYDEALLEAEKTALWNPQNQEAARIVQQIHEFGKSA